MAELAQGMSKGSPGDPAHNTVGGSQNGGLRGRCYGLEVICRAHSKKLRLPGADHEGPRPYKVWG